MEARAPGDSTAQPSSSASGKATQAETKSLLTVGTPYRGEVSSQEADGTYTVMCSSPRSQVSGVLLALPVFGGLGGFNIKCHIPKGTKVAFIYGAPSFISNVLPAVNADWLNAGNRTMVWGPKLNSGDDGIKDPYTPPTEDMVEGEMEIGNMFGVALTLLTTILKMQAGDRAKVECHLINDMVRIVSSQYRHFSGIGDELIFDHGRPTLERGWSSYRHELMNQLKSGEPVAPLSGDGIKEEDMAPDVIASVGRHRLLEYIGFAGDFIHSFITDPPETIVKMLKGQEESAKCAGKSWIHRNSDGGVLVQSVADIRLERVCRIPVPVRIASHEDQEITKARTYEKLSDEYLKLFPFGKEGDKNAYRQAYQLRAYSRWLSRFHAFSRVLQLDKEYKVWTEKDSPVPSWTNAENDKKLSNSKADYYDAYACITIMRDGSILLHDGYGSSIAMSNGNVQISAARHLELEAAGDIRMVAGGSLFVKARRHIEMSAMDGGIILHSYAWIKALCEKGSVWIRSMATIDKPSEAAATPPKPTDPRSEGGPLPEVGNHGILLESTNSGVAVRADKQILLKIDGSGDKEPEDKDYSIALETAGNLRIKADAHLVANIGKNAMLSTGQVMSFSTRSLYASVTEMDFGGKLMFKNGTLSVNSIESNSLGSNIIRGKKVTPWQDPQAPSNVPVGTHLNHILALTEDVEIKAGEDDDGLKALEFTKGQEIKKPSSPWTSPDQGPKWSFPEPTEYNWDDREETKGAFVESVTQQYLRLDVESGKDAWKGKGYDTWTWNGQGISGTRVGDYTTGFGTGAMSYRCRDGENLHKPSASPPTTFSITSPSWSLEPYTFKILKRK